MRQSPDPERIRAAHRPRVSVVIPCFNQGRYLGDAVCSVLNQTYDDFEVIVVDDGSTDQTAAVIAEFRDAVRCVCQENRGLAAARNAGVLAARGELIGFLDADDLWLPQYLVQMVPAFHHDATIGAAYCGWRYVDSAGTVLPRVDIRVVPREEMYQAITFMNFLIPSGVVVRRECFAQVGLFDGTLTSGCEDWDLWIRILTQYGIVGVARALVKYRIHGDNMSSDLEHLERAKRDVVAKHFGTDATRSPAHRRAYGGLYLSSAYAHLERGRIDDGRQFIQRAFAVYPELTNEVQTFYQLAVADQPVGSRGVFATLDLDSGATRLLAHLDAVFASRPASVDLEPYRLQAYANAHLALGTLSYGARQFRATRSFLRRAVTANPKLAVDRRVVSMLVKSLLGVRLINRLRREKQRVTPQAAVSTTRDTRVKSV